MGPEHCRATRFVVFCAGHIAYAAFATARATGAMPMPCGGAVAITPARTSPRARAKRDRDRAREPSVYYNEATIRLPRAIQVAVVPRSDACRQFLASPGTPASMRRGFRSER